MLELVKRNGFLIALVSVLVAGIVWHEQAGRLADGIPQDALVATVMFAMALSLESETMRRTVRRPTGAAIASAINMGLVPPIAWAAGRLLGADLADGLVVASAVPCTIASAAVLTRRAGGNDAIAIVATLVTNLLCFVTTPAWVQLLSGRDAGAELRFSSLAVKLLAIVAAPVALGQALHLFPWAAAWAHRRRGVLGHYAQFGILAMLLTGAVRCGEKIESLGDGLAPLAGRLLAMAAIVAAVHLVVWAAGWKLAAVVGLPAEDRAAVAFSGSQKTLMAGLAVAVKFGGLAVLPMVAYHVEQLILDTLIADRLRRRSYKTKLQKKASAAISG
jgi:sodium/bile acid cotransporter 7